MQNTLICSHIERSQVQVPDHVSLLFMKFVFPPSVCVDFLWAHLYITITEPKHEVC